MKHFWAGFQSKTASTIQFKKHIIVLYWAPKEGGEDLKASIKRLSIKYPSVKVKVVNVVKDPTKPAKHRITEFPTVLLLKDGREVDRLADKKTSATLLEQLFRKASI